MAGNTLKMTISRKKQNGILYLERNNFIYYPPNTSGLTFTYPVTGIKELDVINEQVFTSEAMAFIQSNKLTPQIIMVLLSPDILYEKEILYTTGEKSKDSDKKVNKLEPLPPIASQIPSESPSPASVEVSQQGPAPLGGGKEVVQPISEEEKTRLLQEFLDIVPFEEIASKAYKVDKGVRMIATNKKFYEIIIKAFLQSNFVVDSLIPITMLPKDIIPSQVLNQDVAKKIFQKFESLRIYSMLEENSYALSRTALTPRGITMSTKVTSRREYVLIGVFLTLISILGVVVYTTMLSPSRNTKVASLTETVRPTAVIVPTAIVIPSPTASESAVFNKESLRIQLVGGISSQLDLLRQELISYGYKEIAVRPSGVSGNGRALIVFSANLPHETREEILEQLRIRFLSVTAQESASPEADIVVNL